MAGARPRGFTLVEALVAVSVASVLLSTAAPSFMRSMARGRIEGQANELAVDLQYARSESVRRRALATVAVADGGGAYTLSYQNPVTGQNVVLKTVAMPTTVSINATAPIVFDPLRGMANAVTLQLTSSQLTERLRILTNASGRLQLCSPDGAFRGFPTC